MIWNDDTEQTVGISREEKYGKVTITYVDIVRCKDCKYGAKLNNAKGEPMIECGLMYDDAWLKDPDWFCADGERK